MVSGSAHGFSHLTALSIPDKHCNRDNSVIEKKRDWFVSGFQKFFVSFFQKFICTTIRPTQLEYRELYDWDGAAEFVADYLNFETLEPPFELVSYNPFKTNGIFHL